MLFFADLHIHSRYSRGTSPALEPAELARWAAIKGLTVIGSGDFTHPLWFQCLKDCLHEAAPGLYALTKRGPAVYFILSAEISLIFKQGGRGRRVHLLLLAPSLAAVKKINAALGRRYNLRSDGRPILGASARDISAEILDIDERALIIPAHVWTPWFSLLGSRSGFDSLEECFGDIAPRIHAVETGLSADPPMLARVSSLRRYTMLSNSDAHSAQNLGREASEFDCPLTYEGIAGAIRENAIVRTIEFFPEQGKYHHDGHRACGVSLAPAESRRLGNSCPVCGKPLTLGVLHRVEDLADGQAGQRAQFSYQVPLKQILAQVLRCGENAQKVGLAYASLIERLGPEFRILQNCPVADISRIDERLARAVLAMRENRVRRVPGYDGVYGQIALETAGSGAIDN